MAHYITVKKGCCGYTLPYSFSPLVNVTMTPALSWGCCWGTSQGCCTYTKCLVHPRGAVEVYLSGVPRGDICSVHCRGGEWQWRCFLTGHTDPEPFIPTVGMKDSGSVWPVRKPWPSWQTLFLVSIKTVRILVLQFVYLFTLHCKYMPCILKGQSKETLTNRQGQLLCRAQNFAKREANGPSY